MKINWKEPKFGKKEIELVTGVLRGGYVSEGPKTKELEEKLAKIVGTKHVIMTTSCTAALYLAIGADKRIRNYTEGEVIIPDLTFVGTKNAVEMSGLNLRIIDVEKSRFTFDPSEALHENDKICIPVNLLGRKVGHIDDDSRFTIIYDNAGCLGSKVPNGKVGCYSLQGNKIISCGQGGFCATNDDEYAKVIRQLKDFGRENKYQNSTIGFNLKFNDILAAVTLGQLEKLNERRRSLAMQYLNYKLALEDFGEFIHFSKGEIPLWIEFITEKRDELFDYLESKDIHCRKPWKPFKGLPNAQYYYENCVWLPNGPTLTNEQQNIVIKEIKRFYETKKST